MTRTTLVIVTAALGVMPCIGSSAQACISCDYVPSVAGSASPSHEARPQRQQRSYRAVEERRSRPAKRRLIETEFATKKVETDNTASIKTQATNENSSIAVMTFGLSAPDDKKVELATTLRDKRQTANENSAITTAKSIDTKAAMNAEPKASPASCKKYFPTAGMTLTVPCD